MATDKTIPDKKKVVIEYGLSSQSVPMIWEAISTAPGLTSWFADDVRSDGKNFSFIWGTTGIDFHCISLSWRRSCTYSTFQDCGSYVRRDFSSPMQNPEII